MPGTARRRAASCARATDRNQRRCSTVGAAPTTIVRDSSQCEPSTDADSTTNTGSPGRARRPVAGAWIGGDPLPDEGVPGGRDGQVGAAAGAFREDGGDAGALDLQLRASGARHGEARLQPRRGQLAGPTVVLDLLGCLERAAGPPPSRSRRPTRHRAGRRRGPARRRRRGRSARGRAARRPAPAPRARSARSARHSASRPSARAPIPRPTRRSSGGRRPASSPAPALSSRRGTISVGSPVRRDHERQRPRVGVRMKAGQVAEVGRLDEHRRGQIRLPNPALAIDRACARPCRTLDPPRILVRGRRSGKAAGLGPSGRLPWRETRATGETACCSWDCSCPPWRAGWATAGFPAGRSWPRLAAARRGRRVRRPVRARSPGHRPVALLGHSRGRVARDLGGLDAPRRARRGDPACRDRGVRHRRGLPQPRAPRQDGRDRRRGERGPADPGPGLRLASARVRGVRVPVRPPGRPVRGGSRDPRPPPARGARRLRRALPHGAGVRAPPARAAARRAADLDRRVPAADDAPRRPLGRRVRHRLASRAWTLWRSRSRVSTTRAAPSGGTRRRSAARWASSSGPGRGRITLSRWGCLAARPRRSPPGSSRFATAGVGHVVCMLDPRTEAGIERFAPVIELVRRALPS